MLVERIACELAMFSLGKALSSGGAKTLSPTSLI